jgi:PRC-barrel domain/Domain of unknown function (DUF2382)
MPTPSVEEVRAWLGRVMVDRDGNRLGEITDVYLDGETNRPEWAVVRTGLFGLRSSFVPLAEASEVDDQIQVPHERTLVKDAPNIEADGQLSEAEEAELYRHYGLDYDTVNPDSDQATGQPGRPAAEDQPTASPPDTGEPGGARAGKPAQRRSSEEPATTDAVGSAQPITDEGLGIGEGMSRPFVYETPGPAQSSAGSRRRQPGQVRLRRYLVTEVVTETESGQRHELRVEREPVSDEDVDAATATTAPPQASVQPERPTPDSDWFRSDGDPPADRQ